MTAPHPKGEREASVSEAGEGVAQAGEGVHLPRVVIALGIAQIVSW